MAKQDKKAVEAPKPTGRMVNLEEAAKQLGITYPKAREIVLSQNRIPHFLIGPRGVRIWQKDLEAYMEKIKQEAPEPPETPADKPPAKPEDTKEPFLGREE